MSPAFRAPRTPHLVVAAVALFGVASVVWLARDYSLPPSAKQIYPYADEVGVEPNTSVTVHFNKAISAATVQGNLVLRNPQGEVVASQVTYDTATHAALLHPASSLKNGATYTVTLMSGPQGVLDRHDHVMAAPKTWSFTVGITAPASLLEGPGGPLLLVTSKKNGFSGYYAEILRNEGLNEFTTIDIGDLSASDLGKYDVVVLGEVPVDDRQIQIIGDWVRAGGNLITMRPAARLAESLGWSLATSAAGGPVQHGGYLRIIPGSPATTGLIQQPMQWHGDADRYQGHFTNLAVLHTDDRTAAPYPAVSSMQVGGGNVIVFSYDLAKSVVYTRQGNPDWSGIERDGVPPIRPDDLFYGASKKDPQPDWVDPRLIAIPQADLQQRLLANLILLVAAKPLPRFWYLPRGLKSVIVLTGDDHGHGGTTRRFAKYERESDTNCFVETWECIRATSNIFEGSITSEQAKYFASKGFEVALHVYTACTDWPTKRTKDQAGVEHRVEDRQFEDSLYTQQLQGFAAKYPDLPPPVSNRTDCITWGDYDTQPQVELSHNIRLDTNYYYWPAKWVRNRPGLFTGSALPMRFALRSGEPVDVYQVPTQMTDESGQTYPFTVDTLLKNAMDGSEYFGVFTANMHNDEARSAGAEAIIASARKRRVPVISAAQLLQWLDGRNSSRFRNFEWSGRHLCFSVDAGVGANGLEAILPTNVGSGELVSLLRDERPEPWQRRTLAGISYAAFRAAPGTFCAGYQPTTR